MRLTKASPFVVLLAGIACTASTAHAQRYQAWLRDGQVVSGEKISGFLTETGGGTLDGKNLFEPGNPVRALRDTTVRVEPVGAIVQTTNGDLLPGKLNTHEPVGGYFVITLEGTQANREFEPPQLLVQEAALARVAATRDAPLLKPGEVELRDGRRFACRSIRVQGQRVQLLTKEGVSTVPLSDVRQLEMPGDPLADILADSVWSPEPATPNSIVRIRTAGGAQITVPKALMRVIEIDGKKWLYLRPTWSANTIRILRDRVAWWSFREDHEVPLGELPAQTLKETALINHRPWKRNASVDGAELAAGKLSAEQGLGTHSYSAIAFTLPPGAKEFSTWVGLDRRAGNGGCVKLRICKETAESPPLWESDYLVGGKDPVRVGPLDVSGAKRLVLVTDFAHDGRPAGSDPLDVRDHVAWLHPLVTYDKAKTPRLQEKIARWLPALAGWKLTESSLDRVKLQPAFDPERREWHLCLNCLGKSKDDPPVELERTTPLTARNARLVVEAMGDGQRRIAHTLSIFADSQKRESTMNGDVDTSPTRLRQTQSREYNLGDLVGKPVKLTLLIKRAGNADGEFNGLAPVQLALRPLIESLPEDGKLPTPDVPLAALTPTQAIRNGKSFVLPATGKTTEDKPLEVRSLKLASGYGVPTGTEITYDLDPAYERFIAIVGLANGWQGAGPFEILLDGQVHWTSGPTVFSRNTPGQLIDVALPSGAKQLTLRLKGTDCLGAWGNPGFMKASP